MSTSKQTPMISNTVTKEEIVSKRLALPDVLKPPPRQELHLRFRHGYQATESILPLDIVPPGLRTFRVGRFLQPPMLCYGWPLDIDQLVNIAESKGFLGATTPEKNVRALSRIDIADTQHLLHHVVRDDLGITSITPEIRAILPKSNNREFLISLSTTWNDAWDSPPGEDVVKIAAHLGLSEDVPKWYVDFEEGKWTFRTFPSIPVPRTVYKYGVIHYEGVTNGGCPRCKTRPL